jgi:hypothetical protein
MQVPLVPGLTNILGSLGRNIDSAFRNNEDALARKRKLDGLHGQTNPAPVMPLPVVLAA